jgi:signal peptidase I
MTNRSTRRSQRRTGLRPKAGGSSQNRRTGLRILVFVAVVALVILALASTQFAVQPALTPSPSF